jgi:biopolymer transport protein ExbD
MLPSLDDIEVERIHAPQLRREKRVQVDMNPMVDLAFLLLTFFMLATTFIKPQALELLLPAKPKTEDAAQETPVKESKTLHLVLFENHFAWYRGLRDPKPTYLPYQDDHLYTLLSAQNRAIDGLVVLVKPTVTARYENLVQVLDALAATRIERYALDKLGEYDQTLDTQTP